MLNTEFKREQKVYNFNIVNWEQKVYNFNIVNWKQKVYSFNRVLNNLICELLANN